MKCPTCGTNVKTRGTFTTLLGYQTEDGHEHDNNCLTRPYACPVCTTEWLESVRRRCPKPGCDWRGKATCFCHAGVKVDQWTDPPFDGMAADPAEGA